MEKETIVTTKYKFVKQALIMAMFTASVMTIYEFAASAFIPISGCSPITAIK